MNWFPSPTPCAWTIHIWTFGESLWAFLKWAYCETLLRSICTSKQHRLQFQGNNRSFAWRVGFAPLRRDTISGQVSYATRNALCQCHHADSPVMSRRRWLPRLPGHLITFPQSLLIFTPCCIYNFSILQCWPPGAATQAEPFLSFNGFQVGPRTIPACWLFFSSGTHQICISSTESSVYLTPHSRSSAVHLTLIRFRTSARALKMTGPEQILAHNVCSCTGVRSRCWWGSCADTVITGHHEANLDNQHWKIQETFQPLKTSSLASVSMHTCVVKY